ncbi:MAG: hypothetical protein WBL29_05590 [Burkholderiales bacterium]
MIPRKPLDEPLLRALWLADANVAEIAQALGCSDSHVSHVAHRLGLPRRACCTGNLPQRAIVVAYQQGASLSRIVASLRPRFPTLADTTIKNLLRRRGIALRPRGSPRVEVTECVRLARAGLDCPTIARRLGLTPRQVEYRAKLVLGGLGGRGRKPWLPVRLIVSRAAAGETCVAIARDLGCSVSAVSLHVRAARKRHQRRRATA